MDLTSIVLMAALAYGLGLFWYGLVLGRTHDSIWRTAAYPFTAMVCAEAYAPLGPAIGHTHLLSALIAALVGALVDWAVGMIRGALVAPRVRAATATR